jgi:leucyl-tRNA synthetase
VALSIDELPVLLPQDIELSSTYGDELSPLATSDAYINVKCPKCGEDAKRDADTMDTFVCSSWYYLRYPNAHYDKGPFDPDRLNWLPVDCYIGGAEHATMHLLYFRFYTKVLADMGLLDFREPATRLFNQGMILGEDHEKMSKSRGNVVNPDGLVQRYGSDTVRVYLMFLGPWDAGVPWNPHGIEGASRFLRSVWTLALQENPEPSGVADAEQKIEAWRTFYNQIRPHSALGWSTPSDYARKHAVSGRLKQQLEPDFSDNERY